MNVLSIKTIPENFLEKRSIILYYSIGVIYRTKMLLATKTRKLFGQEAIKIRIFFKRKYLMLYTYFSIDKPIIV